MSESHQQHEYLLTEEQLIELSLKSTAERPTLEPNESQVPVQCMVCLDSIPGAMIAHIHCGQLFCANCALEDLRRSTMRNECPLCKKSLTTTNHTYYRRASPVEDYFIDKILYTCDACKEEMLRHEAVVHHQSCSQENRHVAPEHLIKRSVNPIKRVELYSNPFLPEEEDHKKSKLFIVHHNGVQLWARSFKMHQPCIAIKRAIAESVKVPIDEVKLYKFQHREIPDFLHVRNLAVYSGAQYLASFTNQPKLPTHCAGIIFQGVENPPSDNLPQTPWPNHPILQMSSSRRRQNREQQQQQLQGEELWELTAPPYSYGDHDHTPRIPWRPADPQPSSSSSSYRPQQPQQPSNEPEPEVEWWP